MKDIYTYFKLILVVFHFYVLYQLDIALACSITERPNTCNLFHEFINEACLCQTCKIDCRTRRVLNPTEKSLCDTWEKNGYCTGMFAQQMIDSDDLKTSSHSGLSTTPKPLVKTSVRIVKQIPGATATANRTADSLPTKPSVNQTDVSIVPITNGIIVIISVVAVVVTGFVVIPIVSFVYFRKLLRRENGSQQRSYANFELRATEQHSTSLLSINVLHVDETVSLNSMNSSEDSLVTATYHYTPHNNYPTISDETVSVDNYPQSIDISLRNELPVYHEDDAQALVTQEKAQATQEQSQATQEQAPVIQEQAQATQEQSQATQEQAPVTEEHAQATQEQAPVTEEQAQATQEQSQASQEPSQATQEQSQATQEQAQATQEQAQATQEQAPVTEEQAQAIQKAENQRLFCTLTVANPYALKTETVSPVRSEEFNGPRTNPEVPNIPESPLF